MPKSLVAFDTDHIKGYVFGTNKLREIRGASSLLDRLNRKTMERLANNERIRATPIYMNGGSGLFVVDDTDKAKLFGQMLREEYRRLTGGGASITYAVQELPDSMGGDIWKAPIKDELELLRYRLREAKDCPPCVIALPSHPFMRPCDECGVEYAEKKIRDPNEEEIFCCASCLEKRGEDGKVKGRIPEMIDRFRKNKQLPDEYLWDRILGCLKDVEYTIPANTDRPNDFNEFRYFAESKEYLGLIYADANGMGKKLEELKRLADVRDFATGVDTAVHQAMSEAIKQHLPIREDILLFPFDILLLGGDDIVMVTDAAKAMDVAFTIAKRFHEITERKHTLSVGVVLAPIKYPFGLLLDLVEDTLKFAKKDGAKPRAAIPESVSTQATQKIDYGDTRINFMTVTGSTSHSFTRVYESLQKKEDQKSGQEGKDVEFYATLRPYTVEELDVLLKVIRDGTRRGLGRTKLHQLREAILKMNLSTSVVESLGILRNWKEKQREYVVKQVYQFGERYQLPHSDAEKPGSDFARVTFPWFADGKNTYRTSLLDFAELYDFVAREEDHLGES